MRLSFVAAVDASFSVDDDFLHVTFVTPPGLRPTDSLFVVIAARTEDATPATGSMPEGWSTIGTAVGDIDMRIIVLRRSALMSEPATHDFRLLGEGFGVGAVLLIYRDATSITALPTLAITSLDAGTDLTTPSQVCPDAASVYVGVLWDEFPGSDSITVRGPANGRFNATQSSDGTARRIVVFDFAPAHVGATGERTAHCGDSMRGFGASFLLSSIPDVPVLEPGDVGYRDHVTEMLARLPEQFKQKRAV